MLRLDDISWVNNTEHLSANFVISSWIGWQIKELRTTHTNEKKHGPIIELWIISQQYSFFCTRIGIFFSKEKKTRFLCWSVFFLFLRWIALFWTEFRNENTLMAIRFVFFSVFNIYFNNSGRLQGFRLFFLSLHWICTYFWLFL